MCAVLFPVTTPSFMLKWASLIGCTIDAGQNSVILPQRNIFFLIIKPFYSSSVAKVSLSIREQYLLVWYILILDHYNIFRRFLIINICIYKSHYSQTLFKKCIKHKFKLPFQISCITKKMYQKNVTAQLDRVYFKWSFVTIEKSTTIIKTT